jgi:hypothetical protein
MEAFCGLIVVMAFSTGLLGGVWFVRIYPMNRLYYISFLVIKEKRRTHAFHGDLLNGFFGPTQ